MATKTFKIGEYAVGGIIKTTITGKLIEIKALDWNTKEPVRTGSCLSNEPNAEIMIDEFLNDITTYYYADKVMNWIRSKIDLGF